MLKLLGFKKKSLAEDIDSLNEKVTLNKVDMARMLNEKYQQGFKDGCKKSADQIAMGFNKLSESYNYSMTLKIDDQIRPEYEQRIDMGERYSVFNLDGPSMSYYHAESYVIPVLIEPDRHKFVTMGQINPHHGAGEKR